MKFQATRFRYNSCLKVAGIGCLVLLVLGGIAAVVVYLNARSWMADLSKTVAKQAIEQSELPEDQKQRLLERINTLADDFKNGDITVEQIGRVFERISESPLLPLAFVWAAEHDYVQPSGLGAEEKVAARLTLQRFARGVYEGKIPRRTAENVESDLKQPGTEQLKESVTDEELRAFLTKVKNEADSAQIPEGPFEVNVADELEKAIDEALRE